MRHTVVSFGSGNSGATSVLGFGSGYVGASAGAVAGSTAGTAGTIGGSTALVVGSDVGQYFGTGVLFGQDGQSGQAGTDPITMRELIQYGSFEGANHDIAKGQLLHNVSGLPADSIVNAINTLSAKKEFDPEDWSLLGSACKEGQFEMGLIDSAGNVLAMFTSKGENYVKAKNAAGTIAWGKLKNSGTTTAVEEGSQQGFEAPEETAARLESIAKAATIQVGVSNFRVTD